MTLGLLCARAPLSLCLLICSMIRLYWKSRITCKCSLMLEPNSWKSHCVGQPCGLRTLKGCSLAVGRFCCWYLHVHTHYTQNPWFLINQMVTCPLRGNNPSLWRGNRACFGTESIKSSPGFGSSVLTIKLASGSQLSPLNHFDSVRGDMTTQQSKGDLGPSLALKASLY